MKKIFALCLVFAAAVFLGTAAHAEDFNIDFSDYRGGVADSVVGAADQYGVWNSTSGYSGDFVDINGNATDVSYSLTAGNASWGYNGGNSLVDDSFYASEGNNWSLTLSGLDEGTYDIYYYAPSSSFLATGTFTLNGQAMDSIAGDTYSGTFLQGTHYDIAESISVGSDGMMAFNSTSTSSYRGLAGLQVVSAATVPVAPEPVSSVLFVVGGTVLGFRCFTKKKALEVV